MAKLNERLSEIERTAARKRRGLLIHPLYKIDVSTPEGITTCLKEKHKARLDTPPVYRITDQ